MIETIQWTPEGVVMIDQTRLPREEVYVTCRTYGQVAEAIRSMVIRGAPAIGVAAAMGVARGMLDADPARLDAEMETICGALERTRPTAVNLSWALERMRRVYRSVAHLPIGQVRERLVDEALRIQLEDVAVNEAIGRHGAPLVPDGKTVLTHCNAGALATAGFGTALGVIRAALAAGKRVDVFAGETRPFLQGARLTAWELQRDGIPTTLITDNMAGHFLKSGRIGCVVVGADRIAANGDVANKVGTYSIAVLAKENGVPFYVAAPLASLDLSLASGDEVPIEERAASEVTDVCGVRMAPEGIAVLNPAFDVTPARYVTAIITERGVARAPYQQSLAAMMAGAATAVSLRHSLATLAYRAGKTLRDAPPDFSSFRAAPGTRTPAEILAHMGDLLDWAAGLADGRHEWHDSTPLAWRQEVERFFRALAILDQRLASGAPLESAPERMFSGPIADALCHTGQIAMLRRLAGGPVRGENYFRAEIVAGQVGPDQAPPRREFD